jgi:hypothetical protein
MSRLTYQAKSLPLQRELGRVALPSVRSNGPTDPLHISSAFLNRKKKTFRSVFANNSVLNLHFMKVSTKNDNNFGYEKNTIVVDFQS